jgi:membrane-bound ClpP family serine protease
VAQLLQLFTLLALLLAAGLRQLGLMSAATTALILPAAAVCLVAAEALAPRPGALLGRVWALRVGGAAAATRAQRRVERRVERRVFARSALASATDVAAALVAASWAVLLAGGGGQAKWSMAGAAPAAGGGAGRHGGRKVSERVAAELATLSGD